MYVLNLVPWILEVDVQGTLPQKSGLRAVPDRSGLYVLLIQLDPLLAVHPAHQLPYDLKRNMLGLFESNAAFSHVEFALAVLGNSVVNHSIKFGEV